MSTKSTILSIALAGIGIAAGYGLYQVTKPTPEKPAASKPTKKTIKAVGVLNQKRPDFTLPDLEGKKRSIKEWDGKVVLLNFWATWCPPCRKEMPAFVELQDQYGKQGLQIVGLAIDQRGPVEDFSDGIGVNYPIIFGEESALTISAKYGNRLGQLPYTVLIDRKGIIRYIRKGEITKEMAEEQIKKHL